jgi:hypothetical protein
MADTVRSGTMTTAGDVGKRGRLRMPGNGDARGVTGGGTRITAPWRPRAPDRRSGERYTAVGVDGPDLSAP